MMKFEAIRYLKEMAEEGYVTHPEILWLYGDMEEIPDNVIDFICYIPKPSKPFRLCCGEKLFKEFEKASEEYVDYLLKQELMDKLKENTN